MASQIIKFVLSVAAVSPLLFSSLSPANAQSPAVPAPKSGVHSSQQHSQNTQANKPVKSANFQASTASTKKPDSHTSAQKPAQNTQANKPAVKTNTAVTKSKKMVSASSQTEPTVKLGSKGSAVKEIQEFLKVQKLYNGKIDGVYNQNTRSAMIAFQKSHHLKADGVVGVKTWSAIKH